MKTLSLDWRERFWPPTTRATIRATVWPRASVRFLPVYSPDLNPSETTWSKIKALLRAAEAGSAEQLRLAVARALQRVTAQDDAQGFAACGYGVN